MSGEGQIVIPPTFGIESALEAFFFAEGFGNAYLAPGSNWSKKKASDVSTEKG